MKYNLITEKRIPELEPYLLYTIKNGSNKYQYFNVPEEEIKSLPDNLSVKELAAVRMRESE